MKRTLEPERMDDPDLPAEAHRTALAGLRRLNWISDGGRILAPVLRRVSEQLGRSLRVLDVATGGGDGLLDLLVRSRRWRYPLVGAGCDIRETALSVAAEQARRRGVAAEWFALDARQAPFPPGYDYLITSLFLHHLPDEEHSPLLMRMAAAARHGVLVNDLVRSRFNELLVWSGTRLLSRSPIVHFDGPASVRAALSWEEWQALAARWTIRSVQCESRWPCRVLLHGWHDPQPIGNG